MHNMSEKIRILFSIETNDKWIFDAYRYFYDSLNKSGCYELFCTVCNNNLSDEDIENYNVIDYGRISKKCLNSFIPSSSDNLSKELIKQAEQFSLWANPKKLLERFFLFANSLNLINPDVVIVWNGMADIRGMIRWYLEKQNIPFFFAEKGVLPDSWYIDETGINAESSLTGSLLKYKLSPIEFEKTESYIKTIIESGSSAWEQPERIKDKEQLKELLGISVDSKVIFFPGQVDEDVNISKFSQFKNIAEAVKLILDKIPEDYYLVVKPHPKSKDESKKRLFDLSQNYENLKIIKDINVWDIIEASDLVISINSTVAFEALLRNKTVLLLGDGILTKTGLCKKVNHLELRTEIEKSSEIKSQRFIDYLKTISFVNFLRENYYIFRNKNILPGNLLLRIREIIGDRQSKKYDREEILRIFYKEDISGHSEISKVESAVDYFLKAQNEFVQDNFSPAIQYIKTYKSLMDYSRFERDTKEGEGHIDVSVVIVTYNRKDELKKCLETVSNQNTSNYEVIIVDNGGCEYQSIKQYISQYIKCPINFNLSEGRNIGVHFAHGKIVAFLDDDALVEPDYVLSIKSAFDKYEIFGLRGKTLPKNNVNYIIGSNIYDLGNKPFPTYCNQEGNSAWRRDIYQSMGGMDPLLFGHEGSDLTYRIINKYNEPNKVIYWPETIIYHNYPTKEKAGTKYLIHKRSSDYLVFKHNKNIFVNREEIERLPISSKQTESKSITNLHQQMLSSQSDSKVSIVIACHNCEKYLPACIESIRNQTMSNWELFLLDDASCDDTKNIIEKYSKMDSRIRPYYFKDNAGPYVRRNYAIERAASDFIVIQDSDDIMHPQKLEKLYNEIAGSNRLGIVGSSYLMTLDEFKDVCYCDKIELPVTHNEIMANYKSNLYICWHGSSIIRKSLFETIGLYDEHPYGSDKFWLAKAAEYARFTNRVQFKNIPEYLTYKIEHTSSQQGQLPNLDPRSRRAKFQTYWLYRLMKIREKVAANPGIDICSELRNCKCNDYTAKYGYLFEKWENEKLDENSVSIYTINAVEKFNEGKYVSCIIALDSIEKISDNIAAKMKHYNLLRAMAYYAIDRKERSLEYLNLEITTHGSSAASQFLNDGFGVRHIDNLQVWCEKNADKYDLRVIDINMRHELPVQENMTKVCSCRKPNEMAMPQIPLVTVIIPAYNAAKYIADSIKSVLAQDDRNFELIIINDGSTDNTEDIIMSFKDDRIRYMSQVNRGLAATHNIGIMKSKGEFIIKLDCDDMMTPDFISKHIKQFTEHPEADLVYCDDYLIDENAKPIRIIERPEYSERNILIRDLFRNGFPIVPFRTCIKRSVFDKIGFFDEKLLVAEDYDMMRRFVMHGLKACHLKGALYLRRITKNSLSRKSSEQKAKSHFDVVRRYAETFAHDELFPDTDWKSIDIGKRRLFAKYLTAQTFLAIGCDYVKTNSPPVYAKEAFGHAGRELNECQSLDPNNKQIEKMKQQCELHNQNINKQMLQYV